MGSLVSHFLEKPSQSIPDNLTCILVEAQLDQVLDPLFLIRAQSNANSFRVFGYHSFHLWFT